MQAILDGINSVIGFLVGIVWSDWLVYLCLAAGLFFTIATKGVQIRRLPQMCRMVFSGRKEKTKIGVSDFQSFMITVSARVGTGNIVGTAVAIAYGGPGAVFWMWVLALLGGATAFAESTLAQVYKEEIDGEYRGGTTYVISKGLKQKWLAMIFAVLTAIAFCIGGPGVHSNAMSSALNQTLGVPSIATGIVLVVLMAYVGLGGIKRLAKISTLVSPIMAVAYLLLALVIVIVNIGAFPGVLGAIFTAAFGTHAVFGGIVGSALSWGIKRGIYSNEAGLGTATMPAAAAETSHPAKQGLIQSLSTFVDTLLVCSATAFMILVTGAYNIFDGVGGTLVQNLPGVEEGSGFVIAGVNTLLPGFGGVAVTVMLVLFSFSSLMTAFYAAETNVAYIFKKASVRRVMIWVSRALVLVTTFYGTQVATSNVFSLADLGFGAMAWVNILSIFVLTGVVVKVLKDYENQLRQGIDPIFDPEKAGVKDAPLWSSIKEKYLKHEVEEK